MGVYFVGIVQRAAAVVAVEAVEFVVRAVAAIDVVVGRSNCLTASFQSAQKIQIGRVWTQNWTQVLLWSLLVDIYFVYSVHKADTLLGCVVLVEYYNMMKILSTYSCVFQTYTREIIININMIEKGND